MLVTDATLDSGCLYVVPRDADQCWAGAHTRSRYNPTLALQDTFMR